MGLKNLQLPTESITIAGEVIPLNGLSLPDVTTLIRRHGAAMNDIFERVSGEVKKGEENFDVKSILVTLAQETPVVVAEIICLSARELDAVEETLRLPFPVQIEALEKIVRVTFDAEGGVKNFAETVIRIANSLSGSIQALNSRSEQPSPIGIEHSEAA